MPRAEALRNVGDLKRVDWFGPKGEIFGEMKVGWFNLRAILLKGFLIVKKQSMNKWNEMGGF